MDSPVPHLLHTNLAPSIEDAYRIRNVLSQAEPQLLTLNAQVVQAQEILQQLLRKRDETQAFVRTHKGLLSLVRRMPREIIGEIFFHALPNDTYIKPDFKDAPLVLTRICSEWRNIALASPMLWSSVGFVTATGPPPESLVDAWLQRSGSVPLSLSLISIDPSIGIPIFSLFAKYIHRWRSVKLAFHHRISSRSGFQDIPAGSAPLLENAYVHLPFMLPEVARADSWWINVFRSAPRLRNITWTGPDADLPWPQLTHLDISNQLSLTRALGLLLEAPNLVECRFSNLNYDSEISFQVTHKISVLHERLQQLDIAASRRGADLGIFLERLTLPALKDIKIRGQYPRNPEFPSWRHSHLLSLLSQSSCLLRSLSISNSDITDLELLECLSHTSVNPSLTKLTITHSGASKTVSDTVIKLLTYHISNSCLNPNLKVIYFQGCLIDVSDGLLADMVESRWKSQHPSAIPALSESSRVATLRDVFMELQSFQVQDIKRLEKLRDQGLAVELRVVIEHEYSDDSDGSIASQHDDAF